MTKRNKAASKLGRKIKQVFDWMPSEELLPPTKPSNRYVLVDVKGGGQTTLYEFCDTLLQYKLHLLADKILKDDGFYESTREMLAWRREPENKAWVEAANPHAITADGHLSASAAFC